MKNGERAIVYAFDNENCKIIDIDDLIGSQKKGFELRSEYNSNLSRFICVECGQRLISAHSNKNNVYFRHPPYSDHCILKESDNSNLFDSYRQMAFARESPRHKELKQKIGDYLKKVDGVDINSIDVDSTFIFGKKQGDKRRPDVYCEYKGKRIAFEIQLSYLPLHYIKHRYEFYRDNGIYLIWILDFRNQPKELATFQRDIKYIWKHQNLFMLDESQNTKLFFDCHFKQPFIYQNNSIREKWLHKKVSLANLTFIEYNYSCYHINYEDELLTCSRDLALTQAQMEEKRKDNEAKVWQERVEEEVRTLVNKISEFKKLDYNFHLLSEQFKELTSDYITELNKQVNLDRMTLEGRPLLLHYIYNYKSINKYGGMNIVEFLTTCCCFKFDISAKDREGNGIIQYLFNNPELEMTLYKIKIPIFNRGYRPTEFDKEFLIKKSGKEGIRLYLEFCYYAACDSNSEREIVKNIISFLWFVESAKEMTIIGNNYQNWVQYLVPILSRHPSLWKYIRKVLIKTNLGEELKRVDKKRTIKGKIKEFRLEEKSPISPEVFTVLVKTYPEFFL